MAATRVLLVVGASRPDHHVDEAARFADASLRAAGAELARIEAALAETQAELGIIPAAAAEQIRAQAAVANIDIAAMSAEIRRIKHSLVPALKQLQARCGPDHGEWLHYGATTQDVVDTGVALHARLAQRHGARPAVILTADAGEAVRLAAAAAQALEDYADDASGGADVENLLDDDSVRSTSSQPGQTLAMLATVSAPSHASQCTNGDAILAIARTTQPSTIPFSTIPRKSALNARRPAALGPV